MVRLMKIKIIIQYEETVDNITKIVSDLSENRIDFHTKTSLSSIPKEWIKSIEISDD